MKSDIPLLSNNQRSDGLRPAWRTTAQLHVQLDTSPTMSEEVRKDISAAEQGPKPAGYENEVSQYYQMLSAGE